jgi:hypothetical protein
MDIKNRRYKVFGMVANIDWEGDRLIHWLHERYGKSEETGDGRLLDIKENESS